MAPARRGWFLAVLLCCVGACTGSKHLDDGEAAVLLEAEELQPGETRQRLDDSKVNPTRRAKQPALGKEFSSSSTFNSGTFSYELQLIPGGDPNKALPGSGQERVLAESDTVVRPRQIKLSNLRRVLGASVGPDGTIDQSRVLEAVLQNTADQATEGFGTGRRLLSQYRSDRAIENDELREVTQKMAKKGIKPRVIDLDETPSPKVAAVMASQNAIQEAMSLAQEAHQKSQKQIQMTMRQNKQDQIELEMQHRSARMEANNKLSEEKQVKKANEVSVKSNHAEEAEGAKRVKEVHEKSQKANNMALKIKEVLKKAQEASNKTAVQERKTKESSEKFTAHHQEERQKAMVVRHVRLMAVNAEKRYKEETQKHKQERITKQKTEKEVKGKHKEKSSKLERSKKDLEKELLVKSQKEAKDKKATEKSLKHSIEKDNKYAMEQKAKKLKENRGKVQKLLRQQKLKTKQEEVSHKRTNKRAKEQSVKMKEGAAKAKEMAEKRAEKHVKNTAKETKSKTEKEQQKKKEKLEAMKRAAEQFTKKEAKDKETDKKMQARKKAAEKGSKKVVSERLQKEEKSLLERASRVAHQSAEERKLKMEELIKKQNELGAKKATAVKHAKETSQMIQTHKVKKEEGLEQSELQVNKSHVIADKETKKQKKLAEQSTVLSRKAKEMSNKIRAMLGKVSGKCRRTTYFDVLRENNLIGNLTHGNCKVVCSLEEDLAFGVKIPCHLVEGQEEAKCKYILYSRAFSAETLALEQFKKYAECQLPGESQLKKQKENVPLSVKARIDRVKKLSLGKKKIHFADFMSKLQGEVENGKQVDAGKVIDLLLAPNTPNAIIRDKERNVDNELGEVPESTHALMNRMANKALSRRRSVPEPACGSTIAIRHRLADIEPHAIQGCLATCTVKVPALEVYEAQCRGSGDEKCFIEAQADYHRKIADKWFGYKLNCLSQQGS